MAAQQDFEQNIDKLIEAAIYLSERSVDDPNFGMAKLVKLLYYADCASYVLHGKPITGTTYLHFPHGPYPENWYQARQRMENDGAVTVLYETTVPGYYKYRMLTERPANRELLSLTDLELLDAQVQRFADFNAAGIEQYSHQDISWRSTEDGQPMPYELAGFTAPPLSERSIRAGLDDSYGVAGSR